MAALAAQAAALYLALWFVPQVLHSDAALMRALVDRCAARPSRDRIEGLTTLSVTTVLLPAPGCPTSLKMLHEVC